LRSRPGQFEAANLHGGHGRRRTKITSWDHRRRKFNGCDGKSVEIKALS
jgi:hypothetical protein